MERQMSMTIAEVLQLMISEGGHIAVLRGPTQEYKGFVTVCRGDGVAGSVLSREMLDELVKANFIKQHGRENESKLTLFKLTDDGREANKPAFEKCLKAKLVSLGYPWPENLEGKSVDWVEAEIRAITCADLFFS